MSHPLASGKTLHSFASDIDLLPRGLLGLLLKAMEKDYPPASEEEVDNPIDVRAAFFTKLPKLPIQMTGQRFSGRYVANP